MRVEQPRGERGSLKWIQRAVAERWESLEGPILSSTKAASLTWLSPVATDRFAEYRDEAFLDLIGEQQLSGQLRSFWPKRGPQWDALARAGEETVVLVEAKSHVPEFCTPGTGAGPDSRAAIVRSLDTVAEALGAKPKCAWADIFYQYANRLAHLWFLRREEIDAYLALVGFLGDRKMRGPETAEVWRAAYQVADYALGLPGRHALSRYIIHVNPRVPHD
jgi:hypothetical protein